MTAAAGLALMIIGAILKYAITWQFDWIDLRTVGNIFLAGGLLGLLLGGLLTWSRRRDEARRRAAALREEQLRHEQYSGVQYPQDGYPQDPYRDQYPPR